ncbi:MAG: flavodoxin family protein [Bacilli bacterium]|nr:flavodoxin family protein [Bacilli bacterium]
MKYAIIYDSVSGNTKLLADTIKKQLNNESCVYIGSGEDFDPSICEFVFLGSWCDKGTISENLKTKFYKLSDKKIALFGTCGFGGSQTYFEQIADSMIKELPSTCQIIDSFICQGKMVASVRKRYEKMLENEEMRKQAEVMISNFDKALTHPDNTDLESVKTFALSYCKTVKSLYE